MTHRKVDSLQGTPRRVHRKVYRFRMEPTREQGEALLRMAGARRFVWNWGLARWRLFAERSEGWKEVYAASGKGLTYRQQAAELTSLKKQPEMAWLKEVDRQPLQQALQDLPASRRKKRIDRAYEAFFEGRARFPKFKRKKRDEPRFRIPQRVRVEGSKVYIPKIGWVRIRQRWYRLRRPPCGEPIRPHPPLRQGSVKQEPQRLPATPWRGVGVSR